VIDWKEGSMLRTSARLLALLAAILVASSCAVSEERSGPGADGIPDVVLVCTDDQPDCQDTIATGDLPTGGDDPVAPTTGPGDGAASSGLVADGGLSVSEAIAYEGSRPVAVHGYVVRTSESAHLCEALAELYPLQCSGANLTVVNPNATDDLPLLEDGDVQWSPDVVILIGTVTGTELTIDTTSTTAHNGTYAPPSQPLILNLVWLFFCQGACGLGGQDWVGPHR
jgi:hypothetical protein